MKSEDKWVSIEKNVIAKKNYSSTTKSVIKFYVKKYFLFQLFVVLVMLHSYECTVSLFLMLLFSYLNFSFIFYFHLFKCVNSHLYNVRISFHLMFDLYTLNEPYSVSVFFFLSPLYHLYKQTMVLWMENPCKRVLYLQKHYNDVIMSPHTVYSYKQFFFLFE